MTQWIYLVVAALFETGWLFSLKRIDLASIALGTLFSRESSGFLFPLAGYIVFGIGNIYFFSLALKHIPVSTAFAIWMGVTLAITRIVEVGFLNERATLRDHICLILLLIAIVGLKKTD